MKEIWEKFAIGLLTFVTTVAMVWLTGITGTTISHGNDISSLKTKAASLERADDELRGELRATLLEVRGDIKKLLERKP